MDKEMMKRCLQLAQNGLGSTYPNPLVGAVIVHQGKIIGEGWHRKAGEPHAEIVAINSVTDKSLLQKSTLYVNLEPCSHFGKTPPCAHKIVSLGIPKVVIGTRDLAAHVDGKGIQYLRENGVEVVEDVLVDEARWINRRFFCFHTQKRPYIILKYAQTTNGFMAPMDQQQKWITNLYSKQLTHKWRTEEEAILIGRRTAEIDQPQLNARLWIGKNPLRVLIAKEITNEVKKFLDQDLKTIVFTEEKLERTTMVDFVKIDFGTSVVKQVLAYLHKLQISSIIVEGGAKTLSHFIEQELWDEARVLTGNIAWEDGIKTPTLSQASLKYQLDLGLDNYKFYVRSAS